VLEGTPTVIVNEGQLNLRGIRRERMTQSEIVAAMRQHGVDDVRQVRLAIVESDGHVSVLTSYSPR
jgi:uncharacterized membrane protein YcaP (DUF421 family)